MGRSLACKTRAGSSCSAASASPREAASLSETVKSSDRAGLPGKAGWTRACFPPTIRTVWDGQGRWKGRRVPSWDSSCIIWVWVSSCLSACSVVGQFTSHLRSAVSLTAHTRRSSVSNRGEHSETKSVSGSAAAAIAAKGRKLSMSFTVLDYQLCRACGLK